MGRLRPDPIDSFEFANESISWISGYENEAAVDDASRQIVRYFGLEAFVFGALFRNGEREHYRYLVGCKPDWCYLYNQNKWYAIDPFIDYALHHTSPVLALDVPLTSPSISLDWTATGVTCSAGSSMARAFRSLSAWQPLLLEW